MTFGERIRRLRIQKGWTLKEMAEKLQVSSHSTVANWEYERVEPNIQHLKSISELFQVDVSFLVGSEPFQSTNSQNFREMLEIYNFNWSGKILSVRDREKAIRVLDILFEGEEDNHEN